MQIIAKSNILTAFVFNLMLSVIQISHDFIIEVQNVIPSIIVNYLSYRLIFNLNLKLQFSLY